MVCAIRRLLIGATAVITFSFIQVTAFAHGVSQSPGALIAPPETEKLGPNWSHWLFGKAHAKATITVSEHDGYRYIKSDNLPDHPTGSFPNRGNPHSIKSKSSSYRLTLNPKRNPEPRPIGLNPFGIALNGIVFDPNTAEYFNNDRNSGWNLDALEGGRSLGLDKNNAHVQPDGTYHYHSAPTGLIRALKSGDDLTMIGYAADGFPIYAPINGATSGWRVKSGTRPDGPGGSYDGKYNEDWEYVAGVGTLDACNGMEGVTKEYPNGTYFYVITTAYPYIPRCTYGTPDDSFIRKPKRNGQNQQGIRTNRQRSDQGAQMEKSRNRQQGGAARAGGRPDLNAAAQRLGISAQDLRDALGSPPPDLAVAADKLGITSQELQNALFGN